MYMNIFMYMYIYIYIHTYVHLPQTYRPSTSQQLLRPADKKQQLWKVVSDRSVCPLGGFIGAGESTIFNTLGALLRFVEK